MRHVGATTARSHIATMSCFHPLSSARARIVVPIVVALLLSAAGGRQTILAQGEGWHSSVEANASMLFGASSQTLSSVGAALSHAGEGFTADAGFAFRYGESEDANNVKFVYSRGWAVTMSVDATPKRRLSTFLLGSAEASLEKRIASRRSGGIGEKWVFAKSNTGTANVSVALLGERTVALADTAVTPVSVARWSWRLKMNQRVADRLSFTHVTFYSPIFNAPSRYTVTSTSAGSYALNKTMALTLTFTDNYDNQARGRGAPTNNDGSLLFGIRANF